MKIETQTKLFWNSLVWFDGKKITNLRGLKPTIFKQIGSIRFELMRFFFYSSLWNSMKFILTVTYHHQYLSMYKVNMWSVILHNKIIVALSFSKKIDSIMTWVTCQILTFVLLWLYSWDMSNTGSITCVLCKHKIWQLW